MYVHFSATQHTMYMYFKVYTLLYLLIEISTDVLFAEGSLTNLSQLNTSMYMYIY